MNPRACSPGHEFPILSWKSQGQTSSCFDGIQPPIPPADQSEPSQIPVDKCIGLEEQVQSSSILDGGDPGCSNVFYPPSSSEPRSKPCHSYISTGVIQPCIPPAGQSEPSQIPVDKFIGLDIQGAQISSTIPDDGKPGCSNATGCAPSNSKPWPQLCPSYIRTGDCLMDLQGLPCRFSHGFGSLGELAMDIRHLLRTQGAVYVAYLPNIFVQRCMKHLQAEGWDWSTDSLTSLLRRLPTAKLLTDRSLMISFLPCLLKISGLPFLVLLEQAPAYLGVVPNNYNVMDAGSSARQIFITFSPESSLGLTARDVSYYFSQYRPVSSVQICRSFGFVSFRHPETVRLLLSEWNPWVPHFIRVGLSGSGKARVFVQRYKEKAERTNSAEKHVLKNGCDPGLVTDTVALEVAPPLIHNPPSHSQRESNSLEDEDATRSQHVSDGQDEDSAHELMDEILACLPDIDCFYKPT